MVSDSVEANLAVTRRWYDEWNSEGLDAFQRIWAPDIVLYEAPEFPETGIFRGAEALADHVRDLLEDGGHFQMEPRSLEGRGDYVLSLVEVNVEGPSSGAVVTSPFFQVMRYRNGQLVELRDYLDGDQARREYERLSASSR
jgi:ketosteroid isomerase-like protein